MSRNMKYKKIKGYCWHSFMRSFIISFEISSFFSLFYFNIFACVQSLFIHFCFIFFLLLNVKEHKMPKGYIIITNIGSQLKIVHTLVLSFNLHCLLFLGLLVHSLNRLYTVNVAQVFHENKMK